MVGLDALGGRGRLDGIQRRQYRSCVCTITCTRAHTAARLVVQEVQFGSAEQTQLWTHRTAASVRRKCAVSNNTHNRSPRAITTHVDERCARWKSHQTRKKSISLDFGPLMHTPQSAAVLLTNSRVCSPFFGCITHVVHASSLLLGPGTPARRRFCSSCTCTLA